MRAGGVAATIVLVLFLSGCTSLESSAPGAAFPPGSPPGDSILRSVFAPTPLFTLPDQPLPREVPLALAADPAWVKPLEVTTVRAQSASASALTYAWYAGMDHARIRVTYVDDVPYLTDPDRVHGRASGPHVREGPVAPIVALDTRRMDPGAPPVTLVIPVEGRFMLAPPDAPASGADAPRLNITVSADVPLGTPAYVRIRDGTLEPREVEVHPGDAVTLLNVGSRVARLSIAQVMVRLEGVSGSLSVAPVDEGGYGIVAIARDAADGRGVAALRVLSDFDRPTTTETFGPWSAVFACRGLDACDDERAYPVHAALDVRSLAVNLSTNAPLGAAINVSLLRDGAPVASATLGDGDRLVTGALPAGDYVLRFRGESGVLAGITASARAEYRVPAPPP